MVFSHVAISKSGLRDPHMTPFDLILHFSLELTAARLCAKVEVFSFNRSRHIRGFRYSKSRSRDPFTTLFDLILHFSLGPPVTNLYAKFEVSSLNRSRDMEGVPKFTEWLTDSLTDTQTDFIICPMLLTHWADNNNNKSTWREQTSAKAIPVGIRSVSHGPDVFQN